MDLPSSLGHFPSGEDAFSSVVISAKGVVSINYNLVVNPISAEAKDGMEPPDAVNSFDFAKCITERLC